MTPQALKKYRTYLTDDNGKPVMVQLDLRNKALRCAYEAWMEDFEDTLEAQKRMKELHDDPSLAISWEEAKTRIYDRTNTSQ